MHSFQCICAASITKQVDLYMDVKIHMFSFCGRDPIYFIVDSLQKLDMQVNNLASLGGF